MEILFYQSLKTALLAHINRENETKYRARDIESIDVAVDCMEVLMSDGNLYRVDISINI